MNSKQRLAATLASFFVASSFASVSPGGGGVVIGSGKKDFASVSGEIQTKTSGSDHGAQQASSTVAFETASASAFINVPAGTLGGSATALPRGVSNITASLRASTLVKGDAQGALAVLHIDLNPSFIAGMDGALSGNNFIRFSTRVYAPDYVKYFEVQTGLGFASSTSHCSKESASALYALKCIDPNEGVKSFAIPFALPSTETTLAIEVDFWFQAVDGATLSFDQGVHLSLDLPKNSIAISPSFIPTSAVPESSAGAMALFAIPACLLVPFVRRKLFLSSSPKGLWFKQPQR